MQQVIYVDILIFLNTVITFLILLTTTEISGVSTGGGRLITGSVVGGIYSLLILAPPLNFFLIILTRFAICVSVVFIAFHIRNFRKMMRCLVSFVVISFLFAGFIYCIGGLMNNNILKVNNGYPYFNISTVSLIFITVLMYFSVRIINKKLFRKNRKDMIYKIEIYYKSEKITTHALYDSGNSVHDAYTGRPVIIIHKDEIRPFFDEAVLDIIDKFSGSSSDIPLLGEPFRLIPVKTIAGNKILPAFTADKAVISDGDIIKPVEKPCIALTEDLPLNEKYRALINEESIKQVVGSYD